MPKPDLVDFDNDDVDLIDDADDNESTTTCQTTDDFIVVSKVFDLNTPLDQSDILEHLHCEDCNNHSCNSHRGKLSFARCSFYICSNLTICENLCVSIYNEMCFIQTYTSFT